MENEQQLYNEEMISLLRDIHTAIKRQETKVELPAPVVNVSSPEITVEPTPITVEQKEVVVDTKDLKNALEGILKRLNEKLKVDSPNKVEIKNLKEMETLLKALVDKEAVITVKAGDVNVTFPTGVNPREYIPVRLTDGDQFYNAISALAKGNDSRFEFDKGQLKVTTGYRSNRLDKDDASYYYFGSEDLDGNWIIERMSKDTFSSLFSSGNGGIASVWESRATQNYKEYNLI